MACALFTIAFTLPLGASRSLTLENYFNYFTEIEEEFRKCRSEPVLLSPIDWALVESWKEQGFPLEAVLLGIQRSFEKFKAGKRQLPQGEYAGVLLAGGISRGGRISDRGGAGRKPSRCEG